MTESADGLFVKRLTRLSDTELEQETAEVQKKIQAMLDRPSVAALGTGAFDVMTAKMTDTIRRKHLRRIYTQVIKLGADTAEYLESIGVMLGGGEDDVYAVCHIVRQPDEHKEGVAPLPVEGLITVFTARAERMVCFNVAPSSSLVILGACGMEGINNKIVLRNALVEYDRECAKMEAVKAPHQSQALHERVNLLATMIKQHFDRGDETVSLNVRDIVNGITSPLRYHSAILNDLIA
jgi:hypothetical protein